VMAVPASEYQHQDCHFCLPVPGTGNTQACSGIDTSAISCSFPLWDHHLQRFVHCSQLKRTPFPSTLLFCIMSELDDLDDLDAALASIDIDKDFQMSFMNFDKGGDDEPPSKDDHFQQQLQRPEVFSHRYRPTSEEEAKVQQLSDELNVGSKAGWNGCHIVHQLLNHEGDVKNIILQQGSVVLPDGQRMMVLLTHGFIIAKPDAGRFTSACEVSELYENVIYVKDLWMTSSKESFSLKLASGKEIIFSSKEKKEWLDTWERVLLQNRLHSKSKDETREFGWQYKLVQTSVFTAAVTGAAFFSDVHLEKKNFVDEYNKMAPLHYAAMYNHAHIITALLEYGADPEIRDGEGRTPMYYAQRDEHALAEQSLRDYGAAESSLLDQEKNGELAQEVADFEDDRAKKEEAAKKEELFAGANVPSVEETAAPGSKKSLFGVAFAGLGSEQVQSTKTEQVQHNASAANSQMSENMKLINERGDKINELGKKADKLEENVNEYGSLAAQMKEKMKKENDKLSFPFSMPKVSVPKFKKPF